MNLGKNFLRRTIEVVAKGHPGSFVSLSGIEYDMYHRGGARFLDKEKVETPTNMFP